MALSRNSALICVFVMIAVGFQALAFAGDFPDIKDPKDKQIVEAFCNHARNTAKSLTVEHFKKVEEPEMLCWIELKKLNMSLTAYRLVGDVEHLRDFVVAMENLRACLSKGPDGYLGWRGKPIKPLRDPENPDVVIDEIQTSFRAVAVMANFCEIVKSDAALMNEFGQQYETYIELMTKHLVPKWDARGRFKDFGSRGGTYIWNANYAPKKRNLTLNYEKLSIMNEGLLSLYRVTGDDFYLKRVMKLGAHFKNCLKFTDGCYAWNTWEPTGKWDLHPDNPKKWANWIGAEPIGGWYEVSVAAAVRLYHHGVIFDKTDIERFVKTQTTRCWDGDFDNPKFLRCDGTPSDRPKAQFMAGSLAPFDASVAKFVFTGPRQAYRLSKKDSDWHGGVAADGWLVDKYLAMPKFLSTGKPIHAASTEKFRNSVVGKAFIKTLNLKVTEPGYKTPMTPAQMKHWTE